MSIGAVHHIEIWVPTLDGPVGSWGWILETLGYEQFQSWEHGRSWTLGPTYVVIEQSPAATIDSVQE